MRNLKVCLLSLVLVIILTISGVYLIKGGNMEASLLGVSTYEDSTEGMIQCLADSGLTIYGSKSCPACVNLVKSLGGMELVDPIYLECSEEIQKCNEEKMTNYVPEIQINGELFEGKRTLENFAKETGCNT